MCTIIRIFPKVTEGTGGMEHHIRQLSEEQRLQGVKVILILNEGVKKHEDDIIVRPDTVFYNTYPQFLGFFKFYFFVFILIMRLKLKADIIHIHGDWSSFVFAPIIKKVTKAHKVFFTMHETLRESLTHKSILPYTLKFSTKNFTTGYECYNLIKDYNVSYFQPSGVDKIFFEQNPHGKLGNKIKIITVAQFRPIKNLSLVVKIAQKLPQFSFTLVGDGIEFEKLKNEALIRKATNIIFTGKLTKAEIANLFTNHHLFLLTSLAEGTPTAVMEAMACGLPIVSSNAGGTESIIKDYENGFVIKDDFNDINAYVSNIEKILQNEKLWNKMKNNNIFKAQSFRWVNVARNITKEMLNT